MVETRNVEDIIKERCPDGIVKLHLGCGYRKFDGYINIDLNPSCANADLYQDCTNLSNFPDNSVDEIITYHMVEHVGHRNLIPMFIEYRRVLKPGGKLIFETPNLAEIIKRFAQLTANSGEIIGDFGDGSVYETLYGGQKDAGAFHISLLTPYLAMLVLKAAGFEDIDSKDGHFKIIREIPQYGKEYGIEWNLRFVVEK